MAMKDRMHTGALYLPGDDEIMDRQRLLSAWTVCMNSTTHDPQKRTNARR